MKRQKNLWPFKLYLFCFSLFYDLMILDCFENDLLGSEERRKVSEIITDRLKIKKIEEAIIS